MLILTHGWECCVEKDSEDALDSMGTVTSLVRKLLDTVGERELTYSARLSSTLWVLVHNAFQLSLKTSSLTMYS